MHVFLSLHACVACAITAAASSLPLLSTHTCAPPHLSPSPFLLPPPSHLRKRCDTRLYNRVHPHPCIAVCIIIIRHRTNQAPSPPNPPPSLPPSLPSPLTGGGSCLARRGTGGAEESVAQGHGELVVLEGVGHSSLWRCVEARRLCDGVVGWLVRRRLMSRRVHLHMRL